MRFPILKLTVCARAPVRICDIGGWTDTHYFKNGRVTNFAINLYSYVRVIRNNKNSINIHSENLDLDTQIQDYCSIEYDGVLDLLKAAVKRMDIKEGLDIYVRAEAPPGCGTGTSASVSVALIGALSYHNGKHLLPNEVAALAHAIETEELKLESGVQDQYAAAYGGILSTDILYPLVQVSQIHLASTTACQLESRWILVYLGSRKSSDMHLQVIKRYEDGEENTIKAHHKLKDLAAEMVWALQRDDLDEIARIMNDNWAALQQLYPAFSLSFQLQRSSGMD